MAYELALNPDVQRKLQKEVDDVLSKMKFNSVTYDNINDMKYMDMVMLGNLIFRKFYETNTLVNFLETVRMHPALVWLERACTEAFTLQDSKGQKIHLEIGDHVAIPISGFHYDAQYFANPYKFMPERFADTNKPEGYMAFGLGPRKCIAGRLALMQTKIFYFYLLPKYELMTNDRTENPIQYKKGIAFLRAANGIWLDLKLRNDQVIENK